MDPVSLIGLIAATAQLLQMCGGIAKRCHTACGHFKEASRTLNAIATECRTFEAAITTIQDWIENTLRNSSQKEKLIEPLSSAIEGFMSSISELDKEVAKFGGDEDTLSRSTRARYVWNEAFMKDHLSEIRAQATALHLLLTASQLPIQDATSNIQRAADDATTIYRIRRVRREIQNIQLDSKKSTWTYEESLLDREFMFDDEIVNSMAYRRAMASLLAKKALSKPESNEERLYNDTEKGQDSTDVVLSSKLKSEQGAGQDLTSLMNVNDSIKLIPRDSRGFPLIIKATIEGREERVAEMLDAGAHCEAIVLETGRTSLMEAASRGYTGIIKLLLSYKCRVNPVDRNLMTALLLAVTQGHIQATRALVAGGASTSERDSSGRTPLHLAAHHGHMEIVKVLTISENENDASTFSTLTDTVDAVDLFHKTPLHFAARKGHAAVVDHLREIGARLDLKDRGGRTAMDWAIISGQINIICLLWPFLAIISKGKSEALMKAMSYNQFDVARWLLTKGCKIDPEARALNTAVDMRSVAMAEFILLNGGNVNGRHANSRDAHQRTQDSTPLSSACALEHIEMVKLLLYHDADPNKVIQGDHRRTALHVCTATGNVEIAKLLLHEKALIESPNDLSQRPLDEAAACGHLEMVKLLLRHGARVQAIKPFGTFRSKRNDKPLNLAAAGGHTEMVRLLLDEGAALDDVSNLRHSGTALKTACYHGHVATVSLLLERGAKVALTFDELLDQLQRFALAYRSSTDPPTTLRFHKTVEDETKRQIWSCIKAALIKDLPFASRE